MQGGRLLWGRDCRDTCRHPPPTATLTRHLFCRFDSCFGPCRQFPDRMRGICPFARRQGLRLPCSQGGPLGAPPQVRTPPIGCLGSCTLWLSRKMGVFPPLCPTSQMHVVATSIGGRFLHPLFHRTAEQDSTHTHTHTHTHSGEGEDIEAF